MGSRPTLTLSLLVLALASVACRATGEQARPETSELDDDAVIIGSFDFAENRLLAELYAQALEGAGYEVRRAFDLGPREFVLPALTLGLVELVPEYAGSALRFLDPGGGTPAMDAAATRERLTEVLEGTGLTALAAAAAANSNAFAVAQTTAGEAGLTTISDLREVAGELVFGGPPECRTRALCLVGLEETYGLTFGTVVALDAGGPQTRQALLDGSVDVALMFSSDPSLAGTSRGGDLVELIDDRHLQPAENVTPLVRSEVVARWGPEFVAVIDGVSARLSTDELRGLNRALADTEDPAAVARRWLSGGAAG